MEEQIQRPVLAVTDFTDRGACAVLHAIQLADTLHRDLYIPHVIDDNSKALFKSKKPEAAINEKLTGIAKEIKEKHPAIKVKGITLDGCPCEVINQTSHEIDAVFIVVGIHGRGDVQHYMTPKYATELIKKSRVPYIVVQQKPPVVNQYKKVILSVDYAKENKEKALWGAFFSKRYGSLVYMTMFDEDDEWIRHKSENNLKFNEKILKEISAEYRIHRLLKTHKRIEDASVAQAAFLEAGLLIILNTRRYNIRDYLFGPAERKIIANKEQLPVMCINSREDLYLPCL